MSHSNVAEQIDKTRKQMLSFGCGGSHLLSLAFLLLAAQLSRQLARAWPIRIVCPAIVWAGAFRVHAQNPVQALHVKRSATAWYDLVLQSLLGLIYTELCAPG